MVKNIPNINSYIDSTYRGLIADIGDITEFKYGDETYIPTMIYCRRDLTDIIYNAKISIGDNLNKTHIIHTDHALTTLVRVITELIIFVINIRIDDRTTNETTLINDDDILIDIIIMVVNDFCLNSPTPNIPELENCEHYHEIGGLPELINVIIDSIGTPITDLLSQMALTSKLDTKFISFIPTEWSESDNSYNLLIAVVETMEEVYALGYNDEPY